MVDFVLLWTEFSCMSINWLWKFSPHQIGYKWWNQWKSVTASCSFDKSSHELSARKKLLSHDKQQIMCYELCASGGAELRDLFVNVTLLFGQFKTPFIFKQSMLLIRKPKYVIGCSWAVLWYWPITNMLSKFELWPLFWFCEVICNLYVASNL